MSNARVSDERLTKLIDQLYAWKELSAWANGGWNLPPHVTAALTKVCGQAHEALRELAAARQARAEPQPVALTKLIADCYDGKLPISEAIASAHAEGYHCGRYAAPPVAPCPGIPDAQCAYLADCRSPCNKCGRVHVAPRAAPPVAAEPTEEQVERAARYIADSPLIDAPKLPWQAWCGLARSILKVAPPVAAGWQLVPVEPTEGMIAAADKYEHRFSDVIYRAMLAAAPKPDDGQEGR